jgi:transposase
MSDATSPATRPADAARLIELEREKVALTERLQDAEASLERVRRAYTHALEQLQLLRRRLYVASAERAEVDATQLAFDAMFEQVQALSKTLDAAALADGDEGEDDADDKTKRKRRAPPTGRRDLADTDLPVIRVELTDPELEGKAECIGFEESSRLGYERGGARRIVVARAVYKVTEPEAPPAADAPEASAPTSETPPRFVITPLPKELFRRALLAPSMIAHVLVSKYLLGVPFYRLEQSFALQGFTLDRGTMSRYAEDVGATLGAIVEAARDEAMRTAFCLSTDATGVRIQPGPLQERQRGPCRKGHFFVVLADRDHVFFEYQERHTSAAVCSMFKGYSGYLQADAHAVYDALFAGRPPVGRPPDPEQGPPPKEVGCWSHCRRGFWEAAVCKQAVGVEGLRRIDAIFAADRALADLPPSTRKRRREERVRPFVDAFFAWVEAESVVPRPRGYATSALGYARNQVGPLRRFLEDGRLRLENNGSERALRPIASARKSWLFFGSDDHASAAANLFSLVASCKLHGLDPESYLADVLRVMAYWPRARYLELAPRYWADTRARLDDRELARPLGHVTVPPPRAAEEETATD